MRMAKNRRAKEKRAARKAAPTPLDDVLGAFFAAVPSECCTYLTIRLCTLHQDWTLRVRRGREFHSAGIEDISNRKGVIWLQLVVGKPEKHLLAGRRREQRAKRQRNGRANGRPF
jgi:hypothetical protein